MTPEIPRIEYAEARRVLLNALHAIRPHLDALVLVGAQAVYLRSEGRLPGYQAHTTDAGIVVDPAILQPAPPLGRAMTDAGFVLTSEPGIWEARFFRPGVEEEITVAVDLIVPEQLAPRAGRRSARLPGEHGEATARKIPGLEGAVVDHSPLEITALEPHDHRRVTIDVAGVGALLVAKAFKLGERLETPDRLKAKDAGDVYRLYDATPLSEMTAKLTTLLADDRSAKPTTAALNYLRHLFLTPASPGVALAVNALRTTLPEATVVAFITGYTGELLRVAP